MISQSIDSPISGLLALISVAQDDQVETSNGIGGFDQQDPFNKALNLS